jgi:hypothetical protein
MTDKEERAEEPKAKPKGAVVMKFVGTGYIPGVPGRDLYEEDLDELGEDEMELLRRDGERDAPAYDHKKNLGHSDQYTQARERERAARADEKKKEA